MKLWYPTKPYIITQRFGENSHPYYKEHGMLGHNGIDTIAHTGAPVYCACEGVVNEVCTEIERGLGVGVKSENFKHRYWHFKGINVSMKQKVKVGDILGWADNTGISSGSHLHIELKELNEDGTNKYQNNGYFGAIDPSPYWGKYYAQDYKKVTLIKLLLELYKKVVELLTKDPQ